MSADRERSKGRALVESGASVVGQVAGVAAASFAGPEVATGVSVLLGESLSRIAGGLHDRLVNREAARAGGALAVALDRITERLEVGDTPRDDGFFRSEGEARPDAEELLEGALLTAARAWEEKKVALLGRLYANVLFRCDVAPGHANYLVHLVERLSYRQFVLLGFVVQAQEDGSEYERALLSSPARVMSTGLMPDAQLLAELNDLGDARLVGVRQRDGSTAPAFSTWGSAAGWTPSNLGECAPTPLGLTVADLLELDKLPRAELDEIVADLVP